MNERQKSITTSNSLIVLHMDRDCEKRDPFKKKTNNNEITANDKNRAEITGTHKIESLGNLTRTGRIEDRRSPLNIKQPTEEFD